jgi:hypothetical protein
MFSLGGHLASDNGFQTINLTSGYNFLTSNFMPRLVCSWLPSYRKSLVEWYYRNPGEETHEESEVSNSSLVNANDER